MNCTLRQIEAKFVRTLAGKLLSVVFLCFLFFPQVKAQNVWFLDVAEIPIKGFLDVDALERLSVGDTFNLRVDQNYIYPIRIDGVDVATNGDRSWFGSITNTGLDYALLITVGDLTAHLVLTSPSGIFQFYGSKIAQNRYSGEMTRLEHVRDDLVTTDTIVPGGGGSGGSLPGFYKDVLIEQSASEVIAPVGSKLTFDLQFTNVSGESRSGDTVNIFFLLENTTLDALPESCEILQSTDLQPVLSCSLGDLGIDEKAQLSYSVSTSEQSHPLVYSTIVVDEDRSDLIVEVYRDVITDSDEDGVSDYNEELTGTDYLDGFEGSDEAPAKIDVLVAYTPEIAGIYRGEVDTRVNQLFNVANKIFADSKTGITLRPVGLHEVDYQTDPELMTDLSTITLQSDPAFGDLNRKRKLFGGDLVVLFRRGEFNGLCGLANLGGKGTQGDLSADYHKQFAFSVINIDCLDDSVLAHEVGHNLGLVHSRREDGNGGTLPYSAGYGVDTRFVSVMAFPDDYEVVNRLYRFSDPKRQCGPFSCGSDKEGVEGADAVSSLKLVKHQVERYFSSQENRINTMKPVSTSSGLLNTAMGLGAYTTDSEDFERVFEGKQKISLRMKITPLQDQIGKQFVTHMIIKQGKNTLLQLKKDGYLYPLAGGLKNLEDASEPRIMGRSELFDVVQDLDIKAAGISGDFSVFIAYRMVKTGELIYGSKPLNLTINR